MAVRGLRAPRCRRARRRRARDARRLDALLAGVRADAAVVESLLADRLDAESWEAARDAVRELRFLAKVGDDIEAALAELD